MGPFQRACTNHRTNIPLKSKTTNSKSWILNMTFWCRFALIPNPCPDWSPQYRHQAGTGVHLGHAYRYTALWLAAPPSGFKSHSYCRGRKAHMKKSTDALVPPYLYLAWIIISHLDDWKSGTLLWSAHIRNHLKTLHFLSSLTFSPTRTGNVTANIKGPVVERHWPTFGKRI